MGIKKSKNIGERPYLSMGINYGPYSPGPNCPSLNIKPGMKKNVNLETPLKTFSKNWELGKNLLQDIRKYFPN